MQRKKPKPPKPAGVQANVRYPQDLIDRAIKAAEWEGLTFSAFARSALIRRVRITEAERAAAEDKTKS